MFFLKKTLRFVGWFLVSILFLLTLFALYIWSIADVKPPKITSSSILNLKLISVDSNTQCIGNNWIRKNKWGQYEMYVEGAPYERGVVNGRLSKGLIIKQEEAFTNEIKRMIPSPTYLKFLKYIVGFMNRSLAQNVISEYQQEIYGISQSASNAYNWIGTKYTRILNYHAAHDIGHALQNMMLVGCTSFGAWDSKTANGSLILGRNFDFWVGDQFAENKIIAFYKPNQGHKFAFVTWGGFTGVTSGMNDAGLTVTINAAKSAIPFNAATPVSLVAREILQYAGNIAEALAIAHQRKMFVSESFMIGSAADHKALLIEKTPDTLAVFTPHQNEILCTNHYQTDLFKHQKENEDQKENSASVYRYQRLNELINQKAPLTIQKAADILRDRKGLNNAAIGEGNEKAINQLIAHHSIVFLPDSLQMWVSTNPWQLGTYVCYDLRKIFNLKLPFNTEIATEKLNIAPDSFLKSNTFSNFQQFRKNKLALLNNQPVDTALTVHSNPDFYDAYRVAGAYCERKKWYSAAKHYFQMALQKEIATKTERNHIEKELNQCNHQIQLNLSK